MSEKEDVTSDRAAFLEALITSNVLNALIFAKASGNKGKDETTEEVVKKVVEQWFSVYKLVKEHLSKGDPLCPWAQDKK